MQRRTLLTAIAGAACLGSAPLSYAGWFDRSPPASAYLPLPVLDASQPLRVVYAHNPRFIRPAPQLLADVLARTQVLCQQHLRLALSFDAPVEYEIGALFQGITPTLWQTLLAEALIDTHLARFAQWHKLKAMDDKDLFNGDACNEYFAWVFAPRTQAWPYEVVLTNQLIASVEYSENSLHSALRGGVSNGLTTQSTASRYGTVSVCSLFPMTSMDALTRQLRNDAPGQEPKPVEAIAALLTNELGHQLLHLGHPYNSKACVMNPAELLQFEAWTQGLDAAQCPIGNTKENTPGALRLSRVN